ncbi:MAG: DUF397 domain-containing protein [Streptosporangiales bacterium]|nr:DUF397 domain-containing protein [Streptosporangiales bacterium]
MLWRKSSHSTGATNSDCIELGQSRDAILIRDTQNRAAFTLLVTPAVWQNFADHMKEAGLRP